MKVLIVNASPHRNGNTSIALEEMVKVFRNEGVETEEKWVGIEEAANHLGVNKDTFIVIDL